MPNDQVLLYGAMKSAKPTMKRHFEDPNSQDLLVHRVHGFDVRLRQYKPEEVETNKEVLKPRQL